MMFVRVCPIFLDHLGSGCISSPYNGLNGWLLYGRQTLVIFVA